MVTNKIDTWLLLCRVFFFRDSVAFIYIYMIGYEEFYAHPIILSCIIIDVNLFCVATSIP